MKDGERRQGPQPQRLLQVGDRQIPTDTEGYLVNLDDWSEEFAQAQARAEGLELTPRHWELIRFLREHFHTHGVQAQVRVMIRHFSLLDRLPDVSLPEPQIDFPMLSGKPRRERYLGPLKPIRNV